MKIFSIFMIVVIFSGCSKMQEKKTVEDSKAPVQQTTPPVKSDNTASSENKSSGQTDEKAAELSKTADNSIAKYSADKSEGSKNEQIANCLAAGNYLMFEATLPAREKYRPALKYYRKVLEADPKNEEALKNKGEIERIYESMGMPIPQ